MKKGIVLGLIVLLLITLVGCAQETTSPKSEEELRAEIKAELEAEAQKEKEQEAQKEKEQDAKQEPKLEEPKSEEPKQEKKEQPKNLKRFGDIYDGTHLVPAIEYFDENYDNFSEDTRNEFAQKIVNHLREQVIPYETIMSLEYIPEDSSISVNVNGDKNLVDSLKNLEKTELLTLTMSYWASDGDGVYENGFKFTIHPGIANKLQKALAIVYPNEIPQYYSLDPIVIPNVHYTSMDKPFNSFEALEKGYAQVYLEDSEQLKLFDNENVWKTTLVLPVKINYFEGEERIKELKLSHPIDDDFFKNYNTQVEDGSLNITYNGKTETLIKADEFYMTNFPNNPSPDNKKESSFYVSRAEKDGSKIYFYEITKEGADGELKFSLDLKNMEIFYVEWKAFN